MKLKEIKPEFSLSGIALAELLQATLAKGAPFKFRATGFSMAPFIKDGDVVTVSPCLNPSAHLGRPVAFIQPRTGRLIIHRIIGRNHAGYMVKADSASEIDGLIPRENILGVISKIERLDKEVALGLGPERFIIAFLSKIKILSFIFWLWQIIPFSLRKIIKCKILS